MRCYVLAASPYSPKRAPRSQLCRERLAAKNERHTASAAAEQLADRNQVVEGIELRKQNDLVNATSARSRTT